MAYLQLQSSADYSVHEAFEVDTADHEDHTFNGIMFDVGIRSILPVEYVELDKVWVRGMLGTLNVYVCEGSHVGYHDDKTHWKRVFNANVPPSMDTFVPLELDPAPRVPPGERIGIYVHSSRNDDQGIVYDNKRGETSHEDNILQVYSGAAHISSRPFNINGMWGYGWRPDREFVGRISYGARYLMWRPDAEIHHRFPAKFRRAAYALTQCSMRKGCPLSWVPLEITYFVLNMCPWDWFGDLEDDERPATSEDGENAMSDEDYGGWHPDYRRRIGEHRQSSRRYQEAQRRRDANEEDEPSDSDEDYVDDEDEGDDDDDDDIDDDDNDDDDDDDDDAARETIVIDEQFLSQHGIQCAQQ